MVLYVAPREREARGFLEALFPTPLAAGEYVEARWKPPKDGAMRREFFSNPQEILQVALKLREDYDVYLGVASRQGKIGTKEGVCRLWVIWADLDARQVHTQKTRFKQITDLPYLPSMLVWSGAGWHVYWALEESAEDQEEIARAEALMRRLVEGLDGDPVWDRARILRLPGTLNHKYGNPRRVELVHCYQDKRYTLGQLREMADGCPQRRRGGIASWGGASLQPGSVSRNRKVWALPRTFLAFRGRRRTSSTVATAVSTLVARRPTWR
jgi:hypothetical protein